MHRSDRPSFRFRQALPWCVVGVLLAAIAIVYGQTLGFGFCGSDDQIFVFDCPPVRAGLTGSSIAWAFTNGPGGEWYPLSMMSHMLDCQLFGLNASRHHLTNVLLHAAAAIGLFLVLWQMTGEMWPSAFVAMVFAIHPQHVESVAWIAERRDVLSGLFFVLTLAAYLGYVRHGRSAGRYLLVAVVLGLGLMSKAILVTVPPLLLLLDFWPLGRFGLATDLPQNVPTVARQSLWWLVVEKLLLVAVVLADCAATLATHVQGASPAPWSNRLANAPVAAVTYLVQFFYPANLAVFYPFPAGGHPAWKVAGAVVTLAAISGAAIAFRRRWPFLFVGWFWYLGMLVPVLGLVQVAEHGMADRYTYLSGIGLAVALTWSATRAGARWQAGRWVLGSCAAISIVALVSMSVRQASYWGDDVALWQHSLATTEDNSAAELALANALLQSNQLEDAIRHYYRAAGWPMDTRSLNNLGTVLAREGRLDEAAAEFRRASEVDPTFAPAYANLGSVLALQGRPDEAIQCYLRAIKLDPVLVLPHFKLANLLLSRGETDEAILHFQRVIALDSQHAGAHANLAAALAERGHADQAVAHYRKALELDPNQPHARRSRSSPAPAP